MNRNTTAMVGVAAAAIAGSPALAAPPANAPSVPVAASYSELLEPIPNAVERLRASDAEAAARPAQLILAQWTDHHHHHHHHDRDWYRQNGYVWDGGAWVLGPPAYHHHHHHHHSRRWYRLNGYIWDGGAWALRPAPHHHHHHHHNNY